MRSIAHVLCDGAEYAHLSNNDAEAIERLRDTLHLARALRSDGFLISQIVGIGIDALAVNRVQRIAPGIDLSLNAAATRPTSEQHVRDLIGDLLDERAHWRGRTETFAFERLVFIDFLQAGSDSTWLVRPLATMQKVRVSRHFSALDQPAQESNRPRMRVALRAASLLKGGQEMSFNLFGGTGKPSELVRYSRWFFPYRFEFHENYLETGMRHLADRRVAAVSLAMQLYRADHKRWPQSLEELVPAYLPEVPRDPFQDGGPIGYVLLPKALPDGRDRPLAYFENGDPNVPVPDEPRHDWSFYPTKAIANDPVAYQKYRGIGFRQYRDLARWQPATQPATAPAP